MSDTELNATLDDTRTARRAVRRLKGEVTVGDVVAETGLPLSRAESALRDLLQHYQGHLAVGEGGDLLYRFNPKFLDRDHAPAWLRFRERSWELFTSVYKVSIAVVLVVYFVIFVALAIAAIMAANRGRDGGGGFGGGDRRGGRGGGGFPNFFFWYWIWSPRWGWGRPYYGDRYDPRGKKRGEKKEGPPFYKKVFAYVFGPDQPPRSRERQDSEMLRLARARNGVLSAPELVQVTGMGQEEAEEELTRLMVAQDGQAEPTEAGVVYRFPELMVSAGGQKTGRQPAPAWRRLEPALPVTGNRTGTNVAISALNGFNLVAALVAPFLIFPELGISGPAAWIGLSIFPALFSLSFFAVPLVRRFGVAKENRRRRARNIRRTLLSLITKRTLAPGGPTPISEHEAIETVSNALGEKRAARETRSALDRLMAEFDGEVEVDASGVPHFTFPGFRAAIEAAARLRASSAPSRGVGRIVYDSGDDDMTAAERDLATFDAELASGSADTGESDLADILYLDDPDRFAFRDELELAAMEQEARAVPAGAKQ